MADKSIFDYNMFLIGFMGVGKSTVAARLCQLLGSERIEMDEMIAARGQMPITQMFAEYGEAYFRDMETSLLVELQSRDGAVVSCGGGVVMRPENVDHMRNHGRILWLTAEPETIYARVKDSSDRPILNDHMNVEFISQLMEKRHERYSQAADFVIKTDGAATDEICQEILKRLSLFS